MNTKRRQNLEPVTIGPDGWPQCRFCKGPVYPPKRTMCSQRCIHEYKLRSDISYLRWNVFQRDSGICAICKIDTEEQYENLRKLQEEGSAEFSMRLAEAGVTEKEFKQRQSLWDADHLIEVAEGGGTCGLDNIQTLCIRCHRAKTKAYLQSQGEKSE